MIFLCTQLAISLGILIYNIYYLIQLLIIIQYQQIFQDPAENLKNPVVMLVEVILAITILLDILFRVIRDKKAYFADFWNLVDIISLAVIGVLLLIFYMSEYHLVLNSVISKINSTKQIRKEVTLSEGMENDDIIGVCLISVRYIVQIFRICASIKKQNQSRLLNQEAKEINLQDFQGENTNIHDMHGENFQKQLENLNKMSSTNRTAQNESQIKRKGGANSP